MPKLAYERGTAFLRQLLTYPPAEVKIPCPRCGAPLIYAPDRITAAQNNVAPGLWCPITRRHVAVEFLRPRGDPPSAITVPTDGPILIGAKEAFAIAFEFTHIEPQMGHLCFWIGGQQVGDWDDWGNFCMTRPILGRFMALAGQRIDPALDGLSPADAFALIHSWNYERNHYDAALAQKHAAYDLNNLGDNTFDGVWIYATETPKGPRFLWKCRDDVVVHEFFAPPGALGLVIGEFLPRYDLEIELRGGIALAISAN